jgi:hypothetical protein
MVRRHVIALLVTTMFAVVLLTVLVAGLLRSHADILRALHSLGAGIGDPSADADAAATPIAMGPSLPARRGSGAPAITGGSLLGDAVVVSASAAPRTLLAFLSSGCQTCRTFWPRLADGAVAGTRVVVVAKGLEDEEPAVLRSLAPPGVDVVLSTQAWIDYEVPAAPFFVLLDAERGRIGEGLAASMEQVLDLVRRADGDRRSATHRNGPEREDDIDRALLDAGIRPGDASLYPPRHR